AAGTAPLRFSIPGGSAVRLSGFDASTALALDVTDPDAPVVLTLHAAGDAVKVSAAGDGLRTVVVLGAAERLRPAEIRVHRPASLYRTGGADLLVLTHASLVPARAPLVRQRHSEGLEVLVADVEDVFDAWAGGEKSVEALQHFLADAQNTWRQRPRWALLVGRATYDPRGLLSGGMP